VDERERSLDLEAAQACEGTVAGRARVGAGRMSRLLGSLGSDDEAGRAVSRRHAREQGIGWS
jgi:hypothetical protein